jgi:hypothetical protein
MDFAQVISPLSTDEFCERFLDKRWALLEGCPNRFANLVSWSNLNAVLSSLRLPANNSRLRLVRDGSELPATQYLETHQQWGASLRTGVFERELSTGATLVLNGVDELFSGIREMSQDAERILGRYSWVNLYGGWRTQKGFDLHWDDHDTVIVQVHGRKAWKVYEPTCDHPCKDHSGSFVQPTAPPVWDGILKAGSVLYMPRGWWHVAFPLDEPTLHITLGLNALRGPDILEWLRNQLPQHVSFRRNLPLKASHADQAAYVADFRQVLNELLTSECLGRVKQHADARVSRPAPVDLPHSIVREPSISRDTVVLLSGARGVELVIQSDGRLCVHVRGGEWTCSAGLAQPLSRLSGIVPMTFAELSKGLAPALNMELKMCLMAMHLEGRIILRSSRNPVEEFADVCGGI